MTRSPLDDRHRALGAKITPFGGWDMPLSYPDGTLGASRLSQRRRRVRRLAPRHAAGRGTRRQGRLQWALTNDLDRIGPGRAQYTHLLDPADASVVDDIIVWWVGPDRFDVMPNASNTDRVAAALAEATAASGDDEVSAVDVTATRAVLAVQGPEARVRLATVFAEAAAVERFAVATLSWNGADAVVAGTGYTGEDGVEIAIAVDAAGELWDALLGAGVVPAGLGARDTLRLEAGLPLHGHELGPGITPLQAGLGWVVRWDKGEFRGSDALAAERDAGIDRRLRGIVVEGRRPPRSGQQVVVDGAVVGEVTSGNFSPVLECGIAMAFVPPDLAEGAEVGIDVRGDLVTGRIMAMPFVR
jgi:aminomethyltransferase